MSRIFVKQALAYGINKIKNAGIDSARLDAEILISFLLGCTREKLISNTQCPISNAQFDKYKKLIKKRSKHYPIAYLTGSKEFYGIDFYVNENVLVPRPETESLVENVIDFCRGEPLSARRSGGCSPKPGQTRGSAPTILEIGTGSGCIALTLAKYLPKAKITTSDISKKALVVACGNRRNLRIKNVKLLKSNLLDKVKTKPDILVANLPYLTTKELREKSILREPKLALYGGKDGLDIYRKMFKQIKKKGGLDLMIFIEIGSDQTKEAKKIILNLFPKAEIEIKKDLANRDRVVIIKI